MPEANVVVDVEDVINRLNHLAEDIPNQMVRALNDAAFQLRAKWRTAIATDIKQPTSFTTNKGNVLVDKGSDNSPEATIRVAEAQARYLNFIVRGLKRVGGDIATLGGQTLSPVKARLNQSGDLPSGPPRWLGTLEQKIKNTDVINVHGRRAVYQTLKDGHLKLLAVFQQSIQYDVTLPLFDIADEFSGTFISTMNERINKLLA